MFKNKLVSIEIAYKPTTEPTKTDLTIGNVNLEIRHCHITKQTILGTRMITTYFYASKNSLKRLLAYCDQNSKHTTAGSTYNYYILYFEF